ncbi:MAG: DDE-type integrase/transposase/recombinase [Minisyncoccia bacterium]
MPQPAFNVLEELDTMTKRNLLLYYANQYSKAKSKKEKSKIISNFVYTTKYNRSYACFLLRKKLLKLPLFKKFSSKILLNTKKAKRSKPRIYDEKVFKALRKIWVILDFPCSLRLKALLPQMVAKLKAFGELNISEDTEGKLLKISRSTIDRLLSKERQALNLKPRAKTKPGSLLKKQIPFRTHKGWKDNVVGFVEMDLLSHDGGNAKGEFAFSLVITDISTQWTEIFPLKNKAQCWTFEALQQALKRFPFPIRGIDCDNDSAFINHHLFRWCQEKGIVFTRSRPYWKNDNCHVEQKNWSIGRRYFGYYRYEGEQALKVMKEMSILLSLYVNYFQPCVKLLEKTRSGARVKKIYDVPKTPFERVLEREDVALEIKEELKEIYEKLNPAELRERILQLQDKLFKLATSVRGIKYE